ncbi:A/G-specific adenine glycosylase [Pseudidiomarina insulisalsae]|uniref:Adenine DNA glycosylase n=1 Tax=Pseudidiomarina insulisalsae TaxID=575789 RepID=A0A432YI47_9GAMM|nr:A/G-specific adenine glycosylase [Pseudidiomarina insulisalsae]
MSPEALANCITGWQKAKGRNDLPWQLHNDPYHVLVSELMLQQTQVKTVIPYFERWLQTFPTIEALASASEDEVMTLWQGLGYYRRARNLHAAAQKVVRDYQSEIPRSAAELKEIPGIGPYTVGAIRAFAFDAPAAIVDGNVKRLFARLFALPYEVNKSTNDRYFWQLAEHFTPARDNRRFAQGLLDLGATICKPQQPLCALCPLAKVCQALQLGKVNALPKRQQKKAIPTRKGHFLLDVSARGIVLEQRPASGIWPTLWCLPEVAQAPDAQLWTRFRHTFSHYKLDGHVWLATPPGNGTTRRIACHQLDEVGLPAPIRKLLQQLIASEVCNQQD